MGIHLSKNSVHKECTSSGKALFLSHVKSLRTRLVEYNINPSGDGPARDITTGKELDKDIVEQLLRSSIGNQNDWLMEP